MNIASTIISQIKTIDPMAFSAWGVRSISVGESNITFKTTGMTPWKGYVKVEYDHGMDLYRVSFFKLRKSVVTTLATVHDVFAEDLVNIIDNFVENNSKLTKKVNYSQ